MAINKKFAKLVTYPIIFLLVFGGLIGSVVLAVWHWSAPNREMSDVRANVRVGMSRSEVSSYLGDDFSESNDRARQIYTNTKGLGSEAVPSLIIIVYEGDRVSEVRSSYARQRTKMP